MRVPDTTLALQNKQLISRVLEVSSVAMANWTFLTNHARVLLCIARDPGVRLRERPDLDRIQYRAGGGLNRDDPWSQRSASSKACLTVRAAWPVPTPRRCATSMPSAG